MKRKTLYALALLVIVVDIVIAVSVINFGERRLSALAEGAPTLAELVRKFVRPLPTL